MSKLLTLDTIGLQELQNHESLKIEGGSCNDIKFPGRPCIRYNGFTYFKGKDGKWYQYKIV